ncbi:MAG: arginine N-succinyltransferase [Oceanospirillales bacterium]|uniref:Arginine N-succinyltransferase n=1 Tax=Marinobacterium halophilum TaxID=267374 RepID=A0A2P8EWP4_9GAMM|nr:arginine N-succinyltransferase [Marinobacterium halophilum]MBR9827514.1 arginine N-succinyltransferase [Oceanospirillales bacterium]PSL13868.1 arginine succinyltransferase [Marinobacterium halophilum]
MLRVRPITAADSGLLEAIAVESGTGFTSLPDDAALLKHKIEQSIHYLHQAVSTPSPVTYLFVLEDTESGEVLGTCGITSAVGLDAPWYHYHVGTIVHASHQLGIYNEFRTLYLCNDYTGSSELCSLYLRPAHRGGGGGGLLSRSRFLFMAEHRQRFSDRIIAEMRGFTDQHDSNPFWEGLGQHFFSMHYQQADFLTGSGNKVVIAELMPKHPIYIHLLPAEAQAVIGRVHPDTEPACRLLKAQGFRYEHYVDIFDAGPTLAARPDEVDAIRRSRRVEVVIDAVPAPKDARTYLVSNTGCSGFRCIQAALQPTLNKVRLSAEMAAALEVKAGDPVRLVSLPGT